MSLTINDLNEIRAVVKEEVVKVFDTNGRQVINEEIDGYGRRVIREEVNSVIDAKVEPRFLDIEGRLEALDNDVKELYAMV